MLYVFSIVLVVLTFILVSNHFAKLLAKVAVGAFPVSTALKIVGLYIPEFMQVLIPLSFFIAIFISHGRLHADSEYIVLFACRYSWAKLMKVVLLLALFISFIVALLTTWIVPNVATIRETVYAEGEASGMIHLITPGRFQSMDNGKVVFYATDKDSAEEMEEVFIVQHSKAGTDKPNNIIVAEKAVLQTTEEKENSFFLILKNGHRYTGVPGSMEFTTTKFQEYGRELIRDINVVLTGEHLKNTMSLWNSKKPEEIAELQWRLALPISVFILSIIAVPLARVNPRQGRFARLLPAIIIYIVYYNLITLSYRLVGSSELSPFIGTWLVHISFLVLGTLLLAHVSGRLAQYIKGRKH